MGDEEQHSEEVNPKEEQFHNAKAYLSTVYGDSGLNLYEHLVSCLKRILEERPKNAAEIFESVSKQAKVSAETDKEERSDEKIDRSTEIALAHIQKKLFARQGGDEEEAEEESEGPLPNVMQTTFYFEQAGVGLNREETFRLWLALKKLSEANPQLDKIRFWGKILATEQNYYIAEVEYREGEEIEEEVEEEEGEEEEEKDEKEDEGEEGDEEFDDKPPKPDWKPPPVVPKEEARTGANKKNYFVCNEPGKPWIRLPSVTPAQIMAARSIKKFFTGRLDAPILTYPPFPGTEINYLRAQIARISAGTQVSPAGYYQFDEEEEEDEGEGERENYMENPEFEGVPTSDLVQSPLTNWVHHTMHILPQGRCKWWNPVQKGEEEFEEEDEEDEEQEATNQPVPETGPPLLSSLADDAEVEGVQPWTAKISSKIVPQYAVAVVSSNLWPGAHSFAFGKSFDNVYIGWGHKYTQDNFTPVAPPKVFDEYIMEIKEMDDPTPQEEAALKAQLAADMAEGEEGGEELVEEEDED